MMFNYKQRSTEELIDDLLYECGWSGEIKNTSVEEIKRRLLENGGMRPDRADRSNGDRLFKAQDILSIRIWDIRGRI